MVVAGWYFMLITAAWPPILSADVMGPYPTEGVCAAAKSGAAEFLSARFQECTDDPFMMDAQWLDAIEREQLEAEYGGGM